MLCIKQTHLMSDDLADSEEVSARIKTTKKSYVIIISHEGDVVPFELTNVDILTQFFTDWNNIRTGVRCYIIDKDHACATLVHLPNYVKELCDVRLLSQETLSNIDWKNGFDYGFPPVTFLLCHGGKRDENEPSFLNFGERRHDDNHFDTTRKVWACKPSEEEQDLHPLYWPGEIFLQDLIGTSKIVVLMCCHCDEIVEDYISEMDNKIPHIFYFKRAGVVKTTVIILLALLINLIDSDRTLEKDPTTEQLFSVVKRSIITILKIVKWCTNDIKKFWDFLLDMGVVSQYKSEKAKQGLPVAPRMLPKDYTNHYLVSGHIFHDYIPESQQQHIFHDFRALTLLSPGEVHPVTQNYDSVEPLPSDDSGGQFLREVLLNYLEHWRPQATDTLVSQCMNNIYIV